MTRLSRAVLPVFLLAFSACQLEKLYPDQVAIGIARLSVRNAGTLVSLIQANTTCGFSSRAVLDGAVLTGEWGKLGSAELTVDGCRMDFGDGTVVSKDCNGVETTVSGVVTVSGKALMQGTLTRNPNLPLIPEAANGVHFDLHASFENFVVREAGVKTALTVKTGSLSFRAEPHLAVSEMSGACSVVTRAIGLSKVSYGKSQVFLETTDRQFPAEVDSSSFSAQAGKYVDTENTLEGELTVWGSKQALPTEWDSKGLDPEYDAAKFEASYACAADLAKPVSYQCLPLREVKAQAAARLSVAIYGTLAAYVDDDTTCGFSSPAATKTARVSGAVGKRGGSVTYTLATPCRLSFPEATVARKYCTGLERSIKGTFLVSGTKTVRGIPTGDPNEPVVPTSRDPATATLTFRFQDFELTDNQGSPALNILSGQLSGAVSPRLALDTTTGACSLKTAGANFTNLTWEGASAVLKVDGHQLPFELRSSQLEATNGTVGERSNWLMGAVTIDDQGPVALPRSGTPVLDPRFVAEKFDELDSCHPNLKIATSEEMCSFHQTLGQGAARLLVQNLGALVTLVNKNAFCGFENIFKKANPETVVGEKGEIGSMSWVVNGCEVGGSTLSSLSTDCQGITTWTQGRADVDATRSVIGLREKAIFNTFGDSIVPNSHEAVTFQISAKGFEGFTSVKLGGNTPAVSLQINSGELSAQVKPIMGERQSAPGTFDIPTPVAEISQISVTNANVTLHSGAMQFNFNIPRASLEAFNGTLGSQSNRLTGTINVEDRELVIGQGKLDPLFDQAKFDESYACTADLRSVIR